MIRPFIPIRNCAKPTYNVYDYDIILWSFLHAYDSIEYHSYVRLISIAFMQFGAEGVFVILSLGSVLSKKILDSRFLLSVWCVVLKKACFSMNILQMC